MQQFEWEFVTSRSSLCKTWIRKHRGGLIHFFSVFFLLVYEEFIRSTHLDLNDVSKSLLDSSKSPRLVQGDNFSCKIRKQYFSQGLHRNFNQLHMHFLQKTSFTLLRCLIRPLPGWTKWATPYRTSQRDQDKTEWVCAPANRRRALGTASRWD